MDLYGNTTNNVQPKVSRYYGKYRTYTPSYSTWLCPVKYTPGLWRHKDRKIMRFPCVDDFFIKYTIRNDVDHLIYVPKYRYIISIDFPAKLYCGIALDWNYEKRTCDLSMPGYVKVALASFQHACPNKPQHSPHPIVVPNYAQKYN